MHTTGNSNHIIQMNESHLTTASEKQRLLSLDVMRGLIMILLAAERCRLYQFTVVGMNAIFIYIFFETIGMQWFNDIVAIFVNGFLGMIPLSPHFMALISAVLALAAEWYLCYWLYKRKIFFKL